MIIRCDNCSVSLQLDDSKIPGGNFTVRCPRCQNLVRVAPGARNASPVQQLQENAPAPAMEGNSQEFAAKEREVEINSALRSLLAALQGENKALETSDEATEKPRRVLLCLGQRRDQIAKVMVEDGFKVYLAETPAQANERLREGKTGILLFSPDFAAEYNGAAMLQQKVNKMPAVERRRLFLVSIEDGAVTMSAHDAFLRNLNLLVNTADINQLPLILNRALRDFNEIYRHYNEALGVAAV
jgi:predicted Zn finger-like uncharacterized protein